MNMFPRNGVFGGCLKEMGSVGARDALRRDFREYEKELRRTEGIDSSDEGLVDF